ncbi:Csa1 family protein [Macrococcus capreoli]
MNKNTRKAKGKLYFDTYHHQTEKNTTEEYDVALIKGQIILIGKYPKKASEFLKNFRFLVQDHSIKQLSQFEKIESLHNTNAPLYTIDYKLKENNEINKWLQQKYGVEQVDSILHLKQTGALKGSSTGSFELEIELANDNQSFSESINYMPTVKSELEVVR